MCVHSIPLLRYTQYKKNVNKTFVNNLKTDTKKTAKPTKTKLIDERNTMDR